MLVVKQSGVSGFTRRSYRILLPRTQDAANDMLELMASRSPMNLEGLLERRDDETAFADADSASDEEDTEWLILDYADAF